MSTPPSPNAEEEIPSLGPARRRPPRARRAAFLAIALTLGWLAAELLAVLGWGLLYGELFTPAVAARERSAAWVAPLAIVEPEVGVEGQEREANGEIDVGRQVLQRAEREARALAEAVRVDERTVIHPYLGYVFDPAINDDPERRKGGQLWVTEQGFFRRPEVSADVGEDEAVVGIFGGSVAMVLGFAGEEELRRQLDRHPRLQGRPLRLVNYGLGGYKQPQALLTLAYRISQGERFDVVVLVDGFNEVALPATHNLPQGVNAAYPRHWSARVAGQPTMEQVSALGDLAAARQRRQRVGELFDTRPWRWSAVGCLTGRLLDTRFAVGEARASQQVEDSYSGVTLDYQATGPDYFQLPSSSETLPSPEVFDALAADWRRASLAMHHLALGAGAEFHHFLQPNQYVPDAKPLSALERRQAFRPRHPYGVAVRQGYPRLRREGEVLRAAGVSFTDLSMTFRDVPDTVYVDTCCHLNGEGNRHLARALGEAMVSAAGGAADGIDRTAASGLESTRPK